MHWITFIISAIIIVIAGIKLTQSVDVLSDRFHWGKTWIGIVLLGLVTSLPEGITSLASVLSLNADDLAVGNVLGSNNFNPLLIVMMDIAYVKGAVTNVIPYKKIHFFSALYAMVLTGLVVAEVAWNLVTPIFKVGPLSLGTWAIFILYFVFMRHLGIISKQENEAFLEGSSVQSQEPTVRLVIKLFIAIAFVVGGAMVLANSADVIAETTGLGRTFVGSIFLAIATSLPELVVTLSALHLGEMDLAVGNILGSNMTNMFIVSICDWFHLQTPILGLVSPAHILTGLLSITLVVILLCGIRTKNKKRIYIMGVDSLAMVVLFMMGIALLYQIR
jgi:cation:H+ antiporter